MENLAVYGIAALFFVCVLPVYVSVYAYADGEAKYAQANFCVYRIKFLNVNTAEGAKMQINGKEAQFNPAAFAKDFKIVADHLCVFKIIQLGDYGMEKEGNAYAALFQCAATFPAYCYLSCTGSACKLKNYVIFSEGHSNLRYCAKVVSVVNLIAALKILLIIFMEKFT